MRRQEHSALLLFSTAFMVVVAAVSKERTAPVCPSAALRDDGSCAEDDHQTDNIHQLKQAKEHLNKQEEDDFTCRLWLAEYTVEVTPEDNDDDEEEEEEDEDDDDEPKFRTILGLYTGVSMDHHSTVGNPDMILPMFDVNLKEWSPWHDQTWNIDVVPDVMLQSWYETYLLISGIASLAYCSNPFEDTVNVLNTQTRKIEGVPRANPTAGSFAYRSGHEVVALHDLDAGEQIFVDCSGETDFTATSHQHMKVKQSVQWLEEHGQCMDQLTVGPSTIPNIGKGAFARRAFGEGQVVSLSPLILLDRSQVEMVEQFESREGTGQIHFTERVQGQQLLLNYCFGHPNSTVMLFPTAPGVNFINHGEEANVYIRWFQSSSSDFTYHEAERLEWRASEVLAAPHSGLLMEYVALRDIAPGEELFLDYGSAWTDAWQDHVDNWQVTDDDANYISASDYQRYLQETKGELWFRTASEQENEEDAYPENIQTACFFIPNMEYDVDDEDNQNFVMEVEWTDENYGCLRPCTLVERFQHDKYFYTAEVYPIENIIEPGECRLLTETMLVRDIPQEAVILVDAPYSSDVFLKKAFRHEIGVPDDLFPTTWMSFDPQPDGDFAVPTGLAPGQIETIRWKHNNEIVTKHAHLIGLSPKLRQVLLDYCEQMKITELFRTLTIQNNPLEPDNNVFAKLDGLNWYVQRPKTYWQSNLHWISPADWQSQQDYWRVLSAGGFDDILQSIGETFGLEGLVCYHVTFIAVTHSTQGYIHHDLKETGGRAWNIIIPLLLANETGPELDLVSDQPGEDGEEITGRLRYQYDVASMMGDGAYHGTSAVDYRLAKEMRMAATVYVADVQSWNVDALLNDYTQAYPPEDPSLLMEWAGMHWKRDDPSAKLPKPLTRDFDDSVLAKYEIEPILWKRYDVQVSESAHRMAIPIQVRNTLWDYCHRTGIVGRFHSMLVDNSKDILAPLPDHFNHVTAVLSNDGLEWFIQRPPTAWHSNEHWISPANAKTHGSVLQALGDAGFDDILARIGHYFDLDGLACYHVSFFAVSHSEGGSFNIDVEDADGRAFNVLIPLLRLEDNKHDSPELEILDDGDDSYNNDVGGYHYKYDEAAILGDGTYYSTGSVDYRESKQMHLAAMIYIADINNENVDEILRNFKQAYPPSNATGRELLLGWEGQHWKPRDKTAKLPRSNGGAKTSTTTVS